MNRIAFKEKHIDNMLFFNLVIDDNELSEILNDGDFGIPAWLIDSGLPKLEEKEANGKPSNYIVTVCGCGEYGCGNSHCEIVWSDEVVIFRNFDGDSGNRPDIIFNFAKYQFDNMVSQLCSKANAYKNQFDNGR